MKQECRFVAALLAGLVLGAPLPALGQVVREDGAKSIAGVLYPDAAPMAEWSFKSSGGEVLFASLDADIYRLQAHQGEEATLAEAEGCGDEGGPGLFKLKVLDSTGYIVCSASRPAPPPGWQRDPRLACALPATGGQRVYLLRVELAAPEEEAIQHAYPFLLNVSLRRIAPSGVNLGQAFAWSSSGGF